MSSEEVEQEDRTAAQAQRPKLSAPARHHLALRKRILDEHPELRSLSGPQPLQLLPVLALLVARWGLAYLLRDASLLTIVATSCTVGCWLVHALGTYVHEQGHRLIVQREPWATVVDVVIEMGITSFGTGTAYQYRHVNFHHRYLGDCLPRTKLEPQGPPRPFWLLPRTMPTASPTAWRSADEWDSEMRDLCAHVSIIRAEDVAWLSSRLLQLLEGGLALCTPLGGLVAQARRRRLPARARTPLLR